MKILKSRGIKFFSPQTRIQYRRQISGLLTVFFKTIPTWFFPPRCIGCQIFIKHTSGLSDQNSSGPIAGFFCETCLHEGYQAFEPPFCERCGRHFDSSVQKNYLCASCITSPGRINRVRAALVFDGIIRSGLHQFKYSGKLRAAAFFEPKLFQAFESYFQPDEIDLIVPIPLHISKLRSRGFNQAFVLVRHFKQFYQKKYAAPPHWEINPFCMDRLKKTAPQTGFTPYQRQQNIKNAFKVTRPAKIKNKKILLVDDVYTTGATTSEAARTLLAAGAASVDVLVLARA